MTKENMDPPIKPEDDLGGSESGMTKENMDPPVKPEDDLGGDVKPEDDLGVNSYHYGLGLTRSVGFAFRGSSGQ